MLSFWLVVYSLHSGWDVFSMVDFGRCCFSHPYMANISSTEQLIIRLVEDSGLKHLHCLVPIFSFWTSRSLKHRTQAKGKLACPWGTPPPPAIHCFLFYSVHWDPVLWPASLQLTLNTILLTTSAFCWCHGPAYTKFKENFWWLNSCRAVSSLLTPSYQRFQLDLLDAHNEIMKNPWR